MRRKMVIGLLLLPLWMHAQHVFEAGLHGGVARWNTERTYVDALTGFNAGGQLYYSYLSPYVIGLRTGVTLDCHKAGFGKLNYEDHYSTTDAENEQMDIAYSVGRLSEHYTTWSVGVPLQLALTYQPVTLFAGAKAVFPMSSTWQEQVEHAALSVYYPDYDNRVEDSYPLAASRDFAMSNTGQLQQPNVQWWLAIELNYALPLKRLTRALSSYLMIGVYFDYSLTPVKPAHSEAESLIMLTDTRDGLPLQRVLTPLMSANRQGQTLISQCSLWDAGIKLSYAISPNTPQKHKSHPCMCLH